MKRNAFSAAIAAALVLGLAYNAPASAQDTPSNKTQQRQTIYGYQMMTDEERNEYREKMRSTKTAQERQTLRDEHRATMEARMKERGIEPGQMRGRGAGPMGPGTGQGRGVGGPGSGGPGAGKGPGGPGKGYGPGPGRPGPQN